MAEEGDHLSIKGQTRVIPHVKNIFDETQPHGEYHRVPNGTSNGTSNGESNGATNGATSANGHAKSNGEAEDVDEDDKTHNHVMAKQFEEYGHGEDFGKYLSDDDEPKVEDSGWNDKDRKKQLTKIKKMQQQHAKDQEKIKKMQQKRGKDSQRKGSKKGGDEDDDDQQFEPDEQESTNALGRSLGRIVNIGSRRNKLKSGSMTMSPVDDDYSTKPRSRTTIYTHTFERSKMSTMDKDLNDFSYVDKLKQGDSRRGFWNGTERNVILATGQNAQLGTVRMGDTGSLVFHKRKDAAEYFEERGAMEPQETERKHKGIWQKVQESLRSGSSKRSTKRTPLRPPSEPQLRSHVQRDEDTAVENSYRRYGEDTIEPESDEIVYKL